MSRPASRVDSRGSALVIVLAALALLLSLGVPFLMAGRLRSEASQETFHRATARVSLESAAEYAIHHQAATHPSIDPNPYWDSADEWNPAAGGPLPAALGGDWAKVRESWGVETESLQSRISLASAPPMLVQNLLHPCFVHRNVTFQDDQIPVNSTEGFPEKGRVLIGGRWFEYGSKDETNFKELLPDPNPPDDPNANRILEGFAVIDARVFALCMARIGAEGVRPPEFLNDLIGRDFLGQGLLDERDQQWLERTCTLESGAYGAAQWGPAAWQSREINPDFPTIMRVSDFRAFSQGTMVKIDSPYGAPLYGMVSRSQPSGRGAYLEFPFDLPLDLPPLETRIHPLIREPVDINSCRPEILTALMTGLRFNNMAFPVQSQNQMPGNIRRHWIKESSAREITEAIMLARPIRGHADLWDRVLAPMAGDDPTSRKLLDLWLVYQNALDANNGSLLQSTLPFGYRSGDRYVQRIDAARRSILGRTMGRAAARQEVHLAAEGRQLRVWRTQEDFLEASCWGRGEHGFTTLPNNVGSLGGHHDFPNAMSLRVGVRNETGVMTPATGDQEEQSFVIPAPAWETDEFGPNATGDTRHFEYEASPLGYDAQERGPWVTALNEWNLGSGAGVGSDVEPLHVQGWFEVPPGAPDGTLFDLTGPNTDRARISAAIESGFLVVRGWDNAGEDPLDEFNLQEAVEWKIDPAEYPFAGRWVHLSVLLRGISSRGLQIAVDGVPRGTSNVITYLTSPVVGFAAGSADQEIFVESTEGFPNRGVLRIGDEVIEYSARTSGSFIIERIAGPNDYLGGRAAREYNDAFVNSLDSDHRAGAAVELYGYNAFLATDIPPGGGRLSGDIGPFSVATGVNGTDQIQVATLSLQNFPIGTGINANYTGTLDLAEYFSPDPYFATAFQADGGYALISQPSLIDPVTGEAWIDTDGNSIGGVEIIEYAARTGNQLQITRRNVTPNDLNESPDWAYDGRPRTFVTEWDPSLLSAIPLDIEIWKPFIMPISLKGNGISDVAYLPPDPSRSEFVQITVDTDAGLTEWVRYDRILNSHFVRDDWDALSNAIGARLFDDEQDVPQNPPGGPGGPGGPGRPGPGPGGPGGPGPGRPGSGWLPPWQTSQNPQNEDPDYQFARRIGQPVEDIQQDVQEISFAFQFRGVMGTYDHPQTAGARFVPVFRTSRTQGAKYDQGFVGRLDRVAVMQPGSQLAPNWFTVQWAAPARPYNRTAQFAQYVAFLQDPALAYTASQNVQFNNPGLDPRTVARLVKFPSDERPSQLDSFTMAGSISGGTAPFEGFLDEVSVHSTSGMQQPGSLFARGAFVLDQDLDVAQSANVFLDEYALLVDGRRRFAQNPGDFLQLLPDSGILDIDGERIGFMQIDAGSGRIEISPNGRGLHGTQPRSHAAGATVRIVDGRAASALAGNLTPSDALFPVDQVQGFPQRGLVLMGEELVHTTFRGLGGELGMPRWRPRPDQPNEIGDGMLRGRFGTTPASHDAGTIVYSFPCRWEDRYVPRTDDPGAAWFQISLEEPNAYWAGLQWEAQIPEDSHRIRVQARTGTAGWEDVDGTPGLLLLEEGKSPLGGTVPLNLRSDRLDLRMTFDWDVGSFDPVDFQSVGWTRTPRLHSFLVDFMAEPRVDRHEEVLQ